MTIKARVMAALTNVGVSVFFGDWHPATPGAKPPTAYITFTTMTAPGAHDDDKRVSWDHYIYLTLWSSAPYQTQRAAIISAMETAGFAIIGINEGAENRTDENRCSIDWKFVEEV